MNSPAPDPLRKRIPVDFSARDSEFAVSVATTINIARAAQSRWSRVPLEHRLRRVRRLRALIAENAMQLATASSAGRQCPARESLVAEVLPLAEACRFLEREAEVILAPRHLGRGGKPLWLAGVRSEIHREPFGVILIIGPGNYPLLLPGVQLLQALTVGNAVLLKPGIGGSEVADQFFNLLICAGFDPELISILPESTDAAIAAIAARPDKVLFTGSAATGAKILAQLAPHLIPATMELSGCDAVIVRADADLDLTVKALRFGLNFNGGATCLAPKRVFVSSARATELEGRLAKAFPAMQSSERTGTPATPIQQVAKSHNDEKLRRLIQDTLAEGAHFIAGGLRADSTPITPIILGGVSKTTPLLREDIFAPVLAMVTVADDAEAVACANDCPYALGATIFSRDEVRARNLAAQLKVGTVSINDLILPTADARLPFGGRQRSGFGVTRGAEGLLELTVPKVITVTRGTFRPGFETPSPGDETLFAAYLRLTHGIGWRKRIAASLQFIRQLMNQRQQPRINP